MAEEAKISNVVPFEEPVLSVEDMLAAPDVQYKYVDARPLGWPGRVRIGSLTANDLIEWTEANEGPAKRTAGLRLLIKSLVDKDGNRIGRSEHLEKFKQKSHKAVDAIVKEIIDFNGLVVVKKDAKND